MTAEFSIDRTLTDWAMIDADLAAIEGERAQRIAEVNLDCDTRALRRRPEHLVLRDRARRWWLDQVNRGLAHLTLERAGCRMGERAEGDVAPDVYCSMRVAIPGGATDVMVRYRPDPDDVRRATEAKIVVDPTDGFFLERVA